MAPRVACCCIGARRRSRLPRRCAEREPIKFPDTQYEPVEWASLDGWATDDHATAFAAFLESCRALNGSAERRPRSTTIADALKASACVPFAAVPLEEDGARKFFEDNFRPLRISKLGDSDGFLTGYYEPIIEGSRVPTGEFTAPLYRRPPNLVHRRPAQAWRRLSEQRREGRPARRPSQARALLRRAPRSRTARSTAGIWKSAGCAAVDVLFAQIQGSARIRLEDGTILRVNYNLHNGWPYTPVGRALIERKIFPKDEVSMQRIRDWMTANQQYVTNQ